MMYTKERGIKEGSCVAMMYTKGRGIKEESNLNYSIFRPLTNASFRCIMQTTISVVNMRSVFGKNHSGCPSESEVHGCKALRVNAE